MKRLDAYWTNKNLVAFLMLPLAGVFILLAALRRIAYRAGLFRVTRVPVPVIVVGNITVGGTGKTPLVIWLAQQLRAAGFKPGVASRGYGGQGASAPLAVTPQSDPTQVGDEPVLIATRAACPVVVSRDRVTAARQLAEQGCNVVICDDGLQHYALARDVEIAVVDAARLWGNGWRLPAGPLREPVSRLSSVDFVVYHGDAPLQSHTLHLELTTVQRISDSNDTRPLTSFVGGKIHAVAGIGNPPRFFAQLRAAGLDVIEHPFPDHYAYTVADLRFGDELPVLMTEKDAVKCRAFADSRLWVVGAEARVSPQLATLVMNRLRESRHG